MQKNSVLFQSNEPCTYAFCTFWAVGITPKPPSGHHTSVGTMQQSETHLNDISLCKKTAFTLKKKAQKALKPIKRKQATEKKHKKALRCF